MWQLVGMCGFVLVGCFGGNAEETVFVIVELDDFSVCELEGEDLICHEFIGFMAYQLGDVGKLQYLPALGAQEMASSFLLLIIPGRECVCGWNQLQYLSIYFLIALR